VEVYVGPGNNTRKEFIVGFEFFTTVNMRYCSFR